MRALLQTNKNPSPFIAPPSGQGTLTERVTMDETTTNAPVADGGSQIQGVSVDADGRAVESQPQAAEPAEAVAPTTEPTQDAPVSDEPAQADNSTADWLKKKGIDPTSPEAIEKVAEMARNAEKAMHKKAQQASELEKTVQTTMQDIPADVTDSQLDSIRVRNLELKQELIDWRQNNPDKREYEGQMTQLLNEDPNLLQLVRNGYLGVDKLYAMAKGSDSSSVETAKAQGGREALESLAQKQQAAVPTGNAVNPSGSNTQKLTPQNVDAMVAQMSPEEYRRRLPEINAALAG